MNLSGFAGWLLPSQTARAQARVAALVERILARRSLLAPFDVAGLATTAWNREQFARQVKAALGIDLTTDPDLRAQMEAFRKGNVALIRSLAARKVTQVHAILTESGGATRVEDIAARIRSEVSTTPAKAALLARDQVLKLNGAVTAARHQAAGITEYIWRTSQDERVRETHKALEGRRFTYGQPPVVDPKTGRRDEPGQDYQCRCTAKPVIEEVDSRPPAAAGFPRSEPLELELRSPDQVVKLSGPDLTAEELETVRQHAGDTVTRAGMDDWLRQKPMSEAIFAREFSEATVPEAIWRDPAARADLADANGGYHKATQTILVRAAREPVSYGVPWDSAGPPFSYDLPYVSAAGRTHGEAVGMTSVHEIAHHFYWQELTATERAEVESVSMESLVNDRTVSERAGANAREYFSETHAAYVLDPDALARRDPDGYDLIQRIRRRAGLPVRP